ncbi:hypothetical protein DPMN_188715 [Dreissena polymorpha]|uniref:Uncharacterized protein n=1 Tax=Dreissena polymorpha TaxID=45954 RepID=A0A9D4DRE1_DREPO|nr:hypothetical protein DPMN_188715 [Dreissena polymorpha]
MAPSPCFTRAASIPVGNLTKSATFAANIALTCAQTLQTVACDRPVLSATVSFRSPLATYRR